jgi:UDP:flavonoid glycosyltransferase YjiC (YdhE family)
LARIVYAWELGGGLGHLAHARMIGEPLARAGHEVIFVLRNPLPAVRMLGDLGRFVAAPLWPSMNRSQPAPIFSYPSLLAGLGYGDEEALQSLGRAWRSTFELLAPDLVFTDHAPTAFVGLRGLGVPVAKVGSGFFVPPRRSPMPSFSLRTPIPAAQLSAYEAELMKPLNRALRELGAPEVRGVAELVATPDNVLLAYRELDHYQDPEPDADYWGVPPPSSGARVEWPAAPSGKRVFAYLKPFDTIEPFFEALKGTKAAVLVYAPGLGREIRERQASPSLVFLDRAADIAQMARECDLAIGHGGIGTAAYVLLSGKPMLLLPLQLEQLLFSHSVARLGAGLVAGDRSAEAVGPMLHALLEEPRYREAAEAFARRYAWPTAARFEAKLLDMVGAMLGSR